MHTQDLLLRNLGVEPEKWPKRKVPVVKEDEVEGENQEEPGRTPAEIKLKKHKESLASSSGWSPGVDQTSCMPQL